MKRTLIYLLLPALLVCGKQAYNLLISNEPIRSNLTGALSDIIDEVVAIPLQDSRAHSIREAEYIHQERNNLSFISNETLYRFNRKGEFICHTTHPGDMRVAGYVANPANRQLVVLGNTDDIFYYSPNGNLLTRKKLRCDLPENRHMLSISMHNNQISTIEECAHGDTTGRTATTEKQIVEYDSSFHKLQSHTIHPVDLGHSAYLVSCLTPEVAVEPGSGAAYACAPSYQSGNLLWNTLHIKQERQSRILENLAGKNALSLLPIRMGSCFWVSAYYNVEDESRNYAFRYNTEKEECWQVEEGLKGNFYQIGNV